MLHFGSERDIGKADPLDERLRFFGKNGINFDAYDFYTNSVKALRKLLHDGVKKRSVST